MYSFSCSCCYVRVRGYSFNSFVGLKCDDTLLWWCRWDTSRCAPWFRPRLRRTSWLTIGHWANFRSRRNSFSLRILTRFSGLIDFLSPEALQLCKCRLSTLSKWRCDLKNKPRQVPHQNKFFRLTSGEVMRKLCVFNAAAGEYHNKWNIIRSARSVPKQRMTFRWSRSRRTRWSSGKTASSSHTYFTSCSAL